MKIIRVEILGWGWDGTGKHCECSKIVGEIIIHCATSTNHIRENLKYKFSVIADDCQ